MSKRYTLSIKINTPDGEETLTASEFDSFDEARNAVMKGIRDRKLQIIEMGKSTPVKSEEKINEEHDNLEFEVPDKISQTNDSKFPGRR